MSAGPPQVGGVEPEAATAARLGSDSLAPVPPPASEDKAAAADVAEQVRGEQVRTLFLQGPLVLLGNLVCSGVVTAVTWRSAVQHWLLVWNVLMVLMVTARIALQRRYWTRSPQQRADPRWGHRFTIGSATAGIIWGLAGAFLPESVLHQVMVLFVLGGLVAAATGSLSCYMPAYTAFLVLSLAPAEVRLLAYGDEVHVGMAALLAFFGVALSVFARNLHRSVVNAFRLRFENALLLQRVSQIQRSLEMANHRLSQAKDSLAHRVLERTAELHRSKHQLSEIVRQSPDGIVTLDDRATLVAVNPAFEQMTGFRGDELLGRSLLELSVSRDHDTETWLRTGHQTPFQCELRRKDESSVLVEINPRAVVQPDGQRQIYAVLRDVTARREAEKAKESLELQLRQAQRLESVGLLAGGVAHDFNNVLTVIASNFDALTAADTGGVLAPQRIREIDDAIARATRLTRQLLAFSRQQVVDARIVDINHIVYDVEALLRRVLGERSVLRIAAAPEPATVFADPTQIEQTLVNLVVNARDALPNGGAVDVRVDRATWAADSHAPCPLAPGEYVRLLVADDGVGMDEPTAARIFEPFFTTKGPADGTGLGLSTVHGIVMQCGGHVEVQSRLGEGTCFEILLPYRPEQPVPAPISTAPVPRQADATILLVEDEPQVQLAAQEILASAGYDVLVAGNGEQALDLARKHEYAIDLLVTDAVMPGLSGMELSKQLREHIPELSVLLMSGYTGEPLSTEQLGERVQFLQKPFRTKNLTAAVRRALAHRVPS